MNKVSGLTENDSFLKSSLGVKRREFLKKNHFAAFRKLPSKRAADGQIESFNKFVDQELEKIFAGYFPQQLQDYNNNVEIKFQKPFFEADENDDKVSEISLHSLVTVDWKLRLVQIQKQDFSEKTLKEQLERWLSGAFLVFKGRKGEQVSSKAQITQIGDEYQNQEGRKCTQWTVTVNNKKSFSDNEDLFKLTINASHHDDDPRIQIGFECQHIKQVRICGIPKIDKFGQFNINGNLRIVILQSVRAPGIYSFFSDESNDLQSSYGEIIAFKGPWVSFNYENSRQKGSAGQILKVKFLSTKTSASLAKIFDTVNVRLSEQDISKLFGDDEGVRNSLLTTKHLEDEDNSTRKTLPKFLFDQTNPYFLVGEIGRKKLKALNVFRRINGQKLADDILDLDGNLLVKNGTVIDSQVVDKIKANLTKISEQNFVNIANIKSEEKLFVFTILSPLGKVVKVLGPSEDNEHLHFDVNDLLSAVSYFSNVRDGVGVAYPENFKDNLGNQMIRRIGDLLYNVFDSRLGAFISNLKNKFIPSVSQLKFANLFKFPFSELEGAIKGILLGPLSQQVKNGPGRLSLLGKISVLGFGGFTSVNANIAVRNVNPSHYGRLDLVETPEGQKVGLHHTLACGVEIDKYGQLVAPYLKVNGGVVTNQIDYLTVEDEIERKICGPNIAVNKDGVIEENEVNCRYKNRFVTIRPDQIDYADSSFYHVSSWTSNLVPFNEKVSSGRSSQSVNMIKQACPIINPEVPLIATGVENFHFENSALNIYSNYEGVISYLDSQKIITKNLLGESHEQCLDPYHVTNENSLVYYKTNLKVGDKISVGSLISYSNYGTSGEIALGRNLYVGLAPVVHNFEDGIVVNENTLNQEEKNLRSFSVKIYSVSRDKNRYGNEEFSKQHLSDKDAKNLDADGIIKEGSEVKENEVLVGKRSPSPGRRNETEELLISDIFNNKLNVLVDSSFRMPWGEGGKVSSVIRKINPHASLSQNKKSSSVGFNSNNIEIIEISISSFRDLEVGDKLTSRFGNKGVVAKMVPAWEMPFDEDGRPLDIVFNPLGVPSRMNIGQIFEIMMGAASEKLGEKFLVRPFDSPDIKQLTNLLEEANIKDYGKKQLRDGKTGLPFDSLTTVGIFYVMKLNHMVADKEHSRNTGKYSLYHSQPLKGRSKEGGQRMGEMERNAIEAYGASHFESEMMGAKSDDVKKRRLINQQIIYGDDEFGVSGRNNNESFNSLIQYLWSLGIRLEGYDSRNRKIDFVRDFFDKSTNNKDK